MKEIKNDIIKKYKYKDYVVYIKDVKEDSKNYESYEIYLQNEKYGVIDLMFGVMKEDYSIKELEDLIEVNIEDYILTYKIDYED